MAALTILGAGPAGLAAAYYARKAGLRTHVYDAAAAVGGNCRTLEFDGHRFDTGAHRLHDEIPSVTAEIRDLLGGELLKVDAPSRIFVDGTFVDFPLSPLNLLRVLSIPELYSFARDKWASFGSDPAETFAGFAKAKYGAALAEKFLLGYTEKLWGAPASELSTRVAGRRLKGLDLKTFLLELIGGNRSKVRHLDGSFYYPREGYGAIAEAVADAVGRERIECGARVVGLAHDGSHVREVRFKGRAACPVESVLSTLPLTLTVQALTPAPPPEILEIARSLRFRNVRLVVLVLRRSRFSPNASLYFPDRRDPYTRIYEPKNRSAALSPADETAIVVEVPCSADDGTWGCTDDVLIDEICSSLAAKSLLRREDVKSACTVRMANAYPILEVGFEERAARLIDYLESFENLYLAGRSALFEYTHLHQIFASADQLITRIRNEEAARDVILAA